MSDHLAWHYLAGAAAVTAAVVYLGQKRISAAPGETVTLLGDDLGEHVRRPLRQILAAHKRGLVAQGTGGTWRTHHAMMGGAPREAPIVIAAGFAPLFGPHDRYDSAEDIASFVRFWPRCLVVAVPGAPGADALLAGAKAGGASVCALRPCPELEARKALAAAPRPGDRQRPPCAPSLATSAAWAAEIAHHLL